MSPHQARPGAEISTAEPMQASERSGCWQELAKDHAAAIDLEIERLQAQAAELEAEITGLTGNPGVVG